MGLAKDRGAKQESEWQSLFDRYAKEYPAEAKDLERRFRGELPSDWAADIPLFKPEDGPVATRSSSGKVLNAIAKRVPGLLGGSADLAPLHQHDDRGLSEPGFGSGGRSQHPFRRA